jgi:hypothetical protein
VKESTTTRIQLTEQESGNPSTKFMEITVQALEGIGSGCNLPGKALLSGLAC